ncbi:MAG TPA: choice-of-anchor K domain-containing protein, partial [Anaerolineaceae bacterium]|nr:choice-of-anchor K domain-containing protein [Anaerolineaceae bacterium]
CPDTTAEFLLQSGFGFDGADSTGESYDVNEPFVLGVFCHYNNPVYAPSEQGKLQSVPLDVTVSGLKCDDGDEPDEGDEMTFTYSMRLDETTNTNVPIDECPYPSDVSCSDAVFVSQPLASQQFTCSYGEATVKYTIAPLGFMTKDANGTCPTWNAAEAKRDFISEEGTTNCGCLYGMITDMIVTEVELLYFNAQPGEGVITLQWATATERDNYGFNLYRATSEDGERTLLNAEMIPSLVAPGSPYGAEYEFVDNTAEAGVQYFYWLEDVDIYMKSTFHGPVTAILE